MRPLRMPLHRLRRSRGRDHDGLFLCFAYEPPLVLPQLRHLYQVPLRIMIEPQSEQAGASSWPTKLILIGFESAGTGFTRASAGAPAEAGDASISMTGSRRTMPIASCCVPLKNLDASQRKM